MNKYSGIRNCIVILLNLLVFVFFSFEGNTVMGQQKPNEAFRITIFYNNGIYDSIKVEKLNMIIPLTAKNKFLKTDQFPTGNYFEMFNNEGKIIFRSEMDDPTISLLEYEDPENPGKIKHQIVKHDSGVFSFITKAPANAKKIKFSRILPGQEEIPKGKRRSELLGSFNLTNN
jgi:hypothetical protein